MLRLNLNAHFILLMSINPLTTAHCDKNEHLQMRPVLTTARLFAVSKRPTASQIVPHKTYFKAKLTTNIIGHQGFPKLNPQAYGVWRTMRYKCITD